MTWLRRLGVRYVVLAKAPTDYSSEAEGDLLASGRLPLRIVMATPTLTIFAVPSPHRIVTGPGPSRVVSMSEDGMSVWLGAPGLYRIAVSYSAYWHASAGCVASGKDGMIRLTARSRGYVKMTLSVSASKMLTEMAGGKPTPCS